MLVDELTEQFKRDEADVKARFLEMVGDLDGARKSSDMFGDYASLSKVRGRRGKEHIACYVDDKDAFEQWCRDNAALLVDFAVGNAGDVARWAALNVGEEPAGVRIERHRDPDGADYAKWNLKRDEVIGILRDEYGFELDVSIPKLLEGGEL